tara:strand:- start:46 stop:309 length:264 start_codon:yes stop_codon:yes gene_type:complete
MISTRILKEAQGSPVLDAARNGATGKRSRRTASLRLPPELWEELKRASKVLGGLFPDKYVTVNSTVEFLLREKLESFWSEDSFDEEE